MQKYYIFYYTVDFPKRKGTEKDVIALKKLLQEIGFHDEVTVYQDKTQIEAMTVIKT